MSMIDFQSTAWHEATHAAAMLAQGHIPLEARCDWPYDVTRNGRRRRCNGYVKWDIDRLAEEREFLRFLAIAVMAAMDPMPIIAPTPNGWTDDADELARLTKMAGWDTEAFLRIHFETTRLIKTKRYKRLAVAVYERLTDV